MGTTSNLAFYAALFGISQAFYGVKALISRDYVYAGISLFVAFSVFLEVINYYYLYQDTKKKLSEQITKYMEKPNNDTDK